MGPTRSTLWSSGAAQLALPAKCSHALLSAFDALLIRALVAAHEKHADHRNLCWVDLAMRNPKRDRGLSRSERSPMS